MVSGAVYTIIALVSMISAIACLGASVYYVSISIAQVLMGNLERSSMFFLASIALCVAAYTFSRMAHRFASDGATLINDNDDEEYDEEEEDEYLYIDSGDEGDE